MVKKCVNESCAEPFKYFRGGRLFMVGGPHATREGGEWFWLCPRCAEMFTVQLDAEGHPVLVPKPSIEAPEKQTEQSKRSCGI